MIYDDTVCLLGEGPLWHPERGELFWFDILGQRLHRKGQHFSFPAFVSAAGWVDRDTLLVASAVGLHKVDITTGQTEDIADLETENPVTRSNDGRADPHGGFWIGTMGKHAEPGAGSIWRYYRGEVRRLYPNITISNAICFAPDGRTAYYTDTVDGRVMRQRLSEADGWPVGAPEVFIDARGEDWGLDGAVVDAEGRFWNAQWGAARVTCYSPSGALLETIAFPALQTSCPAFGGQDLSTLFCTSAAVGLSQDVVADAPLNGQTFAVEIGTKGQSEHRVIL